MKESDSLDEPPSRRSGVKLAVVVVVSVLVGFWGCSRMTTPPVEIRKGDAFRPELLDGVRDVAVLPAVALSPVEEFAPRALERTTRVVEAVLAEDPRWELSDPKQVRQVTAEVSGTDPLEVWAGKLASRVDADATLVIRVRRFRDRIGSWFGVDKPAAVFLELLLVLPDEREAVWSASYGVEQQPVSYNLFNLWEVTRGGVRWHTADELARIGVEEALGRLAKMRPVPGPGVAPSNLQLH